MAMLVGLAALGIPRLIVAHAEHDLRPEAVADREFVESLARDHGLAFTWRRLEVRTRGEERAGEGLEARARRVRYEFLTDVAKENGARHVLVAHTADDQTETVLHRVLRGTGIAGLSGMRPARQLCEDVVLVRPLLAIPREVGRNFLRQRSAEWREDTTNTDTTRARNFLRHEILPRCVNGPYPAAVASLGRLASQAGTVGDALASAAAHLLDLYAVRRVDGTVVVKIKPLVGLDRHLLAELFVALWRREGWPQRDMTAVHYVSLADHIVQRAHTAGLDVPGDVGILCDGDTVVLDPRLTRRDGRACSPRSPQSREGSPGRSPPSSRE